MFKGCRQVCSTTSCPGVSVTGKHRWPGESGDVGFGCGRALGATPRHSHTAGQSCWGGLKGKWMSRSYLSAQGAIQHCNMSEGRL